MRKPNIRLRSNIYILKEELHNDKQFHSQIRGRKALEKLFKERNKQKLNLGEENITIELNNLQLAELFQGASIDNCKNIDSWGLVNHKIKGFSFECRCNISECEHYLKCSNKKIFLDESTNKSNDCLGNNEELYEIADIDIKQVIEKEFLDVSIEAINHGLESGKITGTDDEKLLMTCLVSIERITSDIIHLRDITERLEKDVSQIRNKIYEKLAVYKKSN